MSIEELQRRVIEYNYRWLLRCPKCKTPFKLVKKGNKLIYVPDCLCSGNTTIVFKLRKLKVK